MSLKSYCAKTNKSPMIVPSVSMTIKIKRTLTIKKKKKGFSSNYNQGPNK